MALALPLLVLALVLLLVLAALSTLGFSTWRKKGVPHPQPWPLFGNTARAVLQREPIFVTLNRIYRQFPGKPYAGFYAGPSPVLLVRSLDAIKHITVKDFHVFTDHKLSPSPTVDRCFSQFLFCLPGDEWKSMRVKLTPSFSSGRLKAMYPTVRASGQALVKYIRDVSGKDGVLPVNTTCTRYGVDVIAACAFGIDSGALRDKVPSAYMNAVAETFRFGLVEGLTSFTLLFVPLLYRLFGKPIIQEWRSLVLRDLLKESTELRKKEPAGTARKDIFEHLLGMQRTGDVPYELFEAQVISMQVAGSETSAATVMFALWMLARHQDIQEKLREELRAVVKEGGCGETTYETAQDAKYLDMVYKETLRLWPVMPWLDRVALQDYELPGTSIKIEKGTVVMIPIYSIHRDPEHYPNPEVYDPERWSPANPDAPDKQAFIPFGSGPRACIGLRFAEMSVKSALSQVLLNFRVSLTADSPRTEADLSICPKSFIITCPKELPLRFEPL